MMSIQKALIHVILAIILFGLDLDLGLDLELNVGLSTCDALNTLVSKSTQISNEEKSVLLDPSNPRDRPPCQCKNETLCSSLDCGGQCAYGWMGPNCQFKSTPFTPDRWLPQEEGLCANVDNLKESDIVLHMPRSTVFFWMQIKMRPGKLLSDYVSLRFFDSFGERVVSTVIIETFPLTNLNEMESGIFALIPSTEVVFSKLTIGNIYPENVCSVEIPMGVTLTHKRKVFGSAIKGNHPAMKTVDGDFDFPRGGAISDSNSHSWWKIVFSSFPVILSRLEIYTNPWRSKRECSLWIQAVDEKATVVFDVEEKSLSLTNSTIMIFDMPSVESISEIKVSLKQCLGELFLCEVVVYGVSMCPPNKWGINCVDTCENCPGDNRCDVTFGFCLDHECGRAACGGECVNPNRYGSRCRRHCSDNCAGYGACDSISGHCHYGCRNGYLPPTCDLCPSGRTGKHCTEPCTNNTFGQGCLKECHKNCLQSNSYVNNQQICNVSDGSCLYGCAKPFEGPTCQNANQLQLKAMENETSSTIFLVFLIPVVSLVVFFVWSSNSQSTSRGRRSRRNSMQTSTVAFPSLASQITMLERCHSHRRESFKPVR